MIIYDIDQLLDIKCNTSKVDMTGISLHQYINLYYEDNLQWMDLHNTPLYILNRTNNMAYLMMFSESEIEFLSHNEYNDDFIITNNVHDDSIVWTILSHPLLRFCKNYKFNSNWLASRKSGHPTGYFQVGKQTVNNVIDYKKWPFQSQHSIINKSQVDYIIYGNVLDKLVNYDTDGPSELFNEAKSRAELILNWNIHYDNLPIWPYDDPFHVLKRNHPYLEECVHDIIIKNNDILDKFKQAYTYDYQLIINDTHIEKTSYEQYWAYRQNGENYELYP